MFSGVVLAKWSLSWGDITLRAFNFNKLSISLNLDASNFFLSVSDSSTYTTPLLSFGLVPPRKILSRHRTQPFLRLPQRSSSLVLLRRRHSRARLPVLSNQTRFQQEELSNNCWRTPTATKEVLKMQLQTDFPQELRLVSGRDLHAFAWSIGCFPPHPVESLPDRAPGAV